MPKAHVKTEVELLNDMVEALRLGAVQPGLSGYKPQPYQEEFHNCPKKGRLFMGGNRVGKTVSATADACMILCGEHPVWSKVFGTTHIRGRAIGVDFDNGVELILIPEYRRWMPKKFLIDGSWEKSYNKSLRQLTLNNGSTIEFRSYDQEINKFAGTSRHFIHFDEEPPEGIFDENMARLVDTNGIWFISMTPLIDQSWTEDRLYNAGIDGNHPHIAVFEVATSNNKYVSEEAMDALYAGMSEESKAARKAGEYATYKRTVYKELLTEKTFLDPITNDPEIWEKYKGPEYMHIIGLDPGLSNPTCCLWACVDKYENIIIYKEYYKKEQLVSAHAKEILRINQELGIRLAYGVIDPASKKRDPVGGHTVLSTYNELGLPFSPANNDLSAGIERVSNRLVLGKLFVTRDCVKTRWEFGRYRWAKWQSQKVAQNNNLKERPVPKDDHAMDVVRYLCVSRPQLSNEVDTRKGNPLNWSEGTTLDLRDDTLRVQQDDAYDSVLGANF